MEDNEKLARLLSHWIDHNREHAEEFRQWAQRAGDFGATAVRGDILRAAVQMEKANGFLFKALERMVN